MSRILALTLVAGLALTLGACGGGDDDVADDPAPTTSSPTPSPTNTGPLPPDVTDPKPDDGETVTVSGRISLGVEPGCTLLEGNGRLYLLLGGPEVASVEEGDGVRVTGTTAPDVMTTCQQGTPLQVASLEVLPPR
jgi:hypothetical protein